MSRFEILSQLKFSLFQRYFWKLDNVASCLELIASCIISSFFAFGWNSAGIYFISEINSLQHIEKGCGFHDLVFLIELISVRFYETFLVLWFSLVQNSLALMPYLGWKWHRLKNSATKEYTHFLFTTEKRISSIFGKKSIIFIVYFAVS